MGILLGQDREPGSPLPLAQQLRFDAGSPALNLLATRGLRGTESPLERLSSVPRLADWLAGNGLPPVRFGESDVAAARGLREAGYGVLAAIVDGRAPAADDLAALNDWVSRPLPGPRLRPAGTRLSWDDAPATVETVLIGLARDLARLAIDPDAVLRGCDGPTCRMLYLDRSRGHRRRWCSMERCGNAAKAKQHRTRTAAPDRASRSARSADSNGVGR